MSVGRLVTAKLQLGESDSDVRKHVVRQLYTVKVAQNVCSNAVSTERGILENLIEDGGERLAHGEGLGHDAGEGEDWESYQHLSEIFHPSVRSCS